uniref:Pre-mRNA-splicing factor 18 n=1 Tax=Meloidogyne floridensis TaxID=298350 RepID=A0A915PAK7_9BILA
MDVFDVLQGVIAQKRKQIDHIAIETSKGSKMIKHCDLFKKEKEAYLEKQKQLEDEQKLAMTSKSIELSIDEKMSSNTSDFMPRSEVIKKLRIRGLPIRLFAESDEEALKRLRIELEKPDFNVGLKNDFQAALLQVENEEVMEKIAKGTNNTNEAEKLNIVIEETEEDATWEQIQVSFEFGRDWDGFRLTIGLEFCLTTGPKGASSLGEGDDNKDCDLIFAFINYIMKRWAKELNARPEQIKRSPAGKVQAGMQKQTVEHMNPLVKSLEKHSVNSDIRAHLTTITRFCVLDKDYIQANNAYMEMAIGNAPWPVGVTRSGIHQRPGSSKAYASNVAHVMNDETQRKYIHGLKRVLSKCQDFFPTDPKDTWTVERFQLELLNAEKTGQFTCKDLEPLWEKAKLAIENEEEAVSLYTTYIYLTFRLLKKQVDPDLSIIEKLFEDGINIVNEYFDQYSESFVQFQKNFAYFLYAKMGKLQKAREIWTNLLKGENGPFAWLEAISLERKYGDVEYARKLFYKALDNVNFHPHVIYSAFIQFEREEGNRSELDLALERKQKIEEKNGNNLEEKRRPQQKNKQKNEVTRGEEMDIDTIEEEQVEEGKVVTFETSSIPIGPIIPGINDQQQQNFSIEKNEEEKNNGKEDVEMEQQHQQQKGAKEKKIGKEKQQQKQFSSKEQQNSSSFPYSTGLEKNKLFVKHLHFGVKEDELMKFFSQFGKVLDVRIITKWNGRSKGCAYIDFETDSEASAAILKANGEKIRGKEIAVYLSNPPEKKKDQQQLTDNLPSSSSTTPTTSSNNQQQQEGKQQKIKNSLNFIPRVTAQRIGKASRLMLPTSISKNKNVEVKEEGKSTTEAVNSPMGEIVQSTEEISMEQK